MADDLAKRLRMTHVEQSDEELRQNVLEKATTATEKVETKKKDPKDEVTYTFPFVYTDAKGKRYSATLTNRILAIADKMNVAALESSFNSGQPYESVQPLQRAVNRSIAHMTFSLTARADQKPKGWAENLRALYDVDLVLALFLEVSSHEETFHGSPESEAESEEQEGDVTPDA